MHLMVRPYPERNLLEIVYKKEIAIGSIELRIQKCLLIRGNGQPHPKGRFHACEVYRQAVGKAHEANHGSGVGPTADEVNASLSYRKVIHTIQRWQDLRF